MNFSVSGPLGFRIIVRPDQVGSSAHEVRQLAANAGGHGSHEMLRLAELERKGHGLMEKLFMMNTQGEA